MTNNKELFLRWTKYLWVAQIVALVSVIVASISFEGIDLGWTNHIVMLALAYILYQLAPINARYRKAAVFTGISIVLSILVKFVSVSVLTFAVSICSLIAIYQECSAHSEILVGIDDKLARKWHSLFNWQIVGGLILGVLVAPTIILVAVYFPLDANLLATITLALITGFDTILRLVYLSYLKRMRKLCEAIPENVNMD